jgi:hypothetical protein
MGREKKGEMRSTLKVFILSEKEYFSTLNADRRIWVLMVVKKLKIAIRPVEVEYITVNPTKNVRS